MLTIKDIAAEAGVSKSTVSRVLTSNGYVNEETRRKILKVMQDRGYQPSASARSLSQKTSSTIGVIVPEIGNYFFMETFQGITQVVDENNLTIIYCNTENSLRKEEKALRTLESHRVRGMVLTPNNDYSDPEISRELEELIQNSDTPVVFLDREYEHGTYDTVLYDNFGSAYCATSELIKAGNRTVGIITGDMRLKIARDRFEGYQKALSDHGMPLREEYVYYSDFGSEMAYRLAGRMYDSGDVPDGIFTCNNLITLGFLRATRERGYKLGREIAMIGLDHIPVLDMIDYQYSYVTRDMVSMGRMAMELLLERIENPQMPVKSLTVPYKCVLKGAERRDGG